MMKNLFSISSSVEGKESHWYLDNDTPLTVAKEMLFQFQKCISNIEDQVIAQQEAAKVAAEIKPVQDEVSEEAKTA